MRTTLCVTIPALLSLWLPPAFLTGCTPSGPGQCVTNSSNHSDHIEGLSPDSLQCSFDSDLCDYRQGCRDPNMTPWTASNGYAQARQQSVGDCGAASFSVLESPWVTFSHPVCLQVTFSRYRPQALEVFVVYGTSDPEVHPVLEKEGNKFNIGGNQTERLTIVPPVGKILFRIIGGAPKPNGPFLKLYPVTFEMGRCETPDCSFNDTHDPFCGWTSEEWQDDTDRAEVSTSGVVATLTSPLTRATGENHMDCLKFEFRVITADDSLNVTIKTSGVRVLIWSFHNTATGSQWMNATVRIVTQNAYQIVFSGQRGGPGGRVAVKAVQLTTGPMSLASCHTLPQHAAVNVTLPLGPAPPDAAGPGDSGTTAHATGPGDSGTTADGSGPGDSGTTADAAGPGDSGTTADAAGPGDSGTTADGSGPGDSGSNDGKGGDSPGAVIGGTVAAVIVIIVVVIIAVYLYRRRRARKPEERNMTMHSPVPLNGT